MTDKFEDTRKSIIKLVDIFMNSSSSPAGRNQRFESLIKQVISKKLLINFEFFVYVFDSIFNYQISDSNSFVETMIQHSKSKEDRIYKLYYDIRPDDRDETIRIAFEIFKINEEMKEKYLSIFDYIEKERLSTRNSYFANKVQLGDYKYSLVEFDIFLSHRYYLKFYNIIVYYILTVFFNLRVYVDWIFDFEVKRKTLTKTNVKLLKQRMEQSKKLVFFNIAQTQTTNWMAWEVGYFSCLRSDGIAILDLDDYCKGSKNVEVLSSSDRILLDENRLLYLEERECSLTEWTRL